MNDRIETPQAFEVELQAAIAVPPAPDFLRDLRRRLSAAEPVRARPRRLPVRALALGMSVLAVFLAVLLAAGPDRVLALMRSLLGYIPGIGYVDSSSGLRTIAGPVSETRGGVTLTVEQAVFDPQRSVLVYAVEGIPWAVRPASEDSPACLELPALLTADGAALEPTGYELQGWGSGYRARMVFAAIPAADTRATLRVPCLTETAPGGAFEDWELTLQIVPAAADIVVIPVLEIPTPTPEPTAASPFPTAAATPSPLEKIRLQAERAVALDQGWRVEGAVLFDPQTSFVYPPDTFNLRLTDSAGSEVAFNTIPPDSAAPFAEGTQPWALEIPGGEYENPLKLEMTSVEIVEPAEAGFSVDLGEHPASGTVLPLDLPLEVNGQTVTIRSLTFTGKPGGQGSYDLVIALPEGMTGIGVNTPDHPSLYGGGGGLEGDFRLSLGYDDLQAGLQRLAVDSVTMRRAGSWKTTFDLPAGEATQAEPTAACLTADTWNSLVAASPALPPGLEGMLVVEGPVPAGADFPGLFAIHPDGTGRVDLPSGGWPSIGLDGYRAVYTAADGIHLHSLVYGGDSLVTTAGPNAYHPLLSPNGMYLAYMDTAGDPGLYILWVDGHETHKVPGTDAWVNPAGWMPDGRRIVVTRISADGVQVQTLDVETGRAENGFAIQQAKGGFAALSLRGDRLAFSEQAFGLPNYGVFTAALGGSDKRFIAALEGGMTAEAGAWSPDGIWLAVIVTSYADPLAPVQTSILVNPDTCEMALLPFKGAVRGWAP